MMQIDYGVHSGLDIVGGIAILRMQIVLFEVELVRCNFFPRVFYERQRISKKVKANEIIVNIFLGVGCFSIIIAKNNPTALVFS
jgi:tRNA G37 N-methylase Trm5